MGRGVIISGQKSSKTKIPSIIYQAGWQDVISYNNNGYSAGSNLTRSCGCDSYSTPASGSGFSFVIDCTHLDYITMAIYIGGSGSTDSYGTVSFTGAIGGKSASFSNYVASTEYGGSSTTLRWDVSDLTGKQTFTSSWRATCRGPGDWVWSTNQTISISSILCGYAAPYYLIPENSKYPFTITGGYQDAHTYDYSLTSYYFWYNDSYGNPRGWSTATTTIDLNGHKKATLVITGGSMECTNGASQSHTLTLNIGGRSTNWSVNHTAGWEHHETWTIPSSTITLDLTGLVGRVTCTISTSCYGGSAGQGRYGVGSLYIE